MSYSLCRCPLNLITSMLLSVFWLTTFSHLCDVTRTHFSTKAHWVTLYWRYEMHPFFWWHLHLSGGLESRQKSFVYSGVNPYPHPIYINNPLSFLRKVKHHYHLWSCLTCREHMQLLPFTSTVSTTFASINDLSSCRPITWSTWDWVKRQLTFTYHHWWHDMQFCTGSTSWEYVYTLWDQTKVVPLQEICTCTLNICTLAENL